MKHAGFERLPGLCAFTELQWRLVDSIHFSWRSAMLTYTTPALSKNYKKFRASMCLASRSSSARRPVAFGETYKQMVAYPVREVLRDDNGRRK